MLLLLLLSVVGPQAIQELWVIMSDKLLEAIGLEPDPEIVAIMVDSLCKVCWDVNPATLGTSQSVLISDSGLPLIRPPLGVS